MQIEKGKYKFSGSSGKFKVIRVTPNYVTVVATYAGGDKHSLQYDRNQFEQMIKDKTWIKLSEDQIDYPPGTNAGKWD
jgi:hypothetical protein